MAKYAVTCTIYIEADTSDEAWKTAMDEMFGLSDRVSDSTIDYYVNCDEDEEVPT